MKKTWILILMISLVVYACGPSGEKKTEETTEPVATEEETTEVKVETMNPKDRAIEILTVYKAIDLEKLAELSSGMVKPYINEMINDKENSQYDGFFDSWRMRAVEKWDGQISEIKYRTLYEQNQALAGFLYLEEEDEMAVLVLAFSNDQWLFRDVEAIDKSEYDELTSEPE